MAIKEIIAYLNTDGTGAQAIAFYESALGAKAESVQTFGDANAPGMEVAPADKGRIMHALLRIGGGTVMLSDGPPGMPIPRSSNTHVSLHFDDPADLEKKFAALSQGGQVTMPPQDTFWGARFGMLTDAFGINWMFNCELKKG
jgi:PhnB protein